MLKARRYRGEATLVLEGGECGSFSILADWTDRAVPTHGTAHLLSAPALVELVELAQRLKAPGVVAATNQKGVDRCA